jgi:hypothetical protein
MLCSIGTGEGDRQMGKIRDLDTALAAIADGVTLAIPAYYAGVAM